MLRMCGVPRRADMRQVPRACFDRRQTLNIVRPVPRQQLGRAINARVTEPRFRAGDQASRLRRAMIARQEPHTAIGLQARVERQLERAGRKLAGTAW